MASLRKCASSIRQEAAEGIAWIAVWKVGRSWNVDTVWPEDMLYDEGVMILGTYDLDRLREIIKTDPNAILVSGEYSNIGCSGTGELPDLQVLTDKLRWQYEDCHLLISDWDLREVV